MDVLRTRIAVAAGSGDGALLLLLALVTIVLRLPWVGTPLGIDEGGYAYVAANWNVGEGGIYGEQWLDRPPLLIALYAAAIALAGDAGVRLLGCAVAVLLVVACARTARVLAGPAAMAWAGFAAVVLSSSTLLQAHTVNAELPASALVAASVWLTVEAFVAATSSRAAWFAFAAGTLAVCAVLVKQSFVDALASAFAVLVVATVLAPAGARPRIAAIAAAGLAGIALTLAGTVAWAELVGPGTVELVDALYGFRVEARELIDASRAPDRRAAMFLLLLVATGLLALFAFVWIGLVRVALGRQRVRRATAEAWVIRAACAGLGTAGLWGVVAITQGGNWWRHYLVQLVPVVAVGVGIVLGGILERRRSHVARATARSWHVVAPVTIVAWAVGTAMAMSGASHRDAAAAGDWLREAARPGDTLVVTWGHSNVLRRSGLQSPYGLSWSLPVRVRDPKLDDMYDVVSGPQPPTWIVEWQAINLWGLDRDKRIRRLVNLRYDRVGELCGRNVYRLSTAGSTGSLPALPDAEACSSNSGSWLPGGLRW